MRETGLRAITALVIALALVTATGCVRVELPDPGYETRTERVNAGSATALEVEIDMGAGQLDVSGGAAGAMDATFEYGPAALDPHVDYAVDAGTGRLSVRTPNKVELRPFRDMHYVWDVALTDDLPLELAVRMGAGESDLDLRGTDLRRLSLDLGAGDATIDLSGDWAHDIDVRVAAGAGELTVRVPAGVGVRVRGHKDGIGEFTADGFRTDGNALVNDAYDDADVRFELTLSRGVGSVNVETID